MPLGRGGGGPLSHVPRPFLSEQAVVGLTIWDRNITESQARSGDLPILRVNNKPAAQSNIYFNMTRVSLDEINKYARRIAIDEDHFMIEGANVTMRRGPTRLFADKGVILDSRLMITFPSDSVTLRDVENIAGGETENLGTVEHQNIISFTTHVIFHNGANKVAEKLGVDKERMIFQSALLEVEDEDIMAQ